MIWFFLASAWACEPTEAIAHLQSGEKIEDYLCLARTTPALAPLVEALLATKNPESQARLSQALSLYLLERSSDNWDPSLLALLSPADRRLLVDGLHARRGRPSPAPAQAKIFEQLGWYKPDPHYTDGRLTAQDLEKIHVLEHPPAPVVPPPAPVAAPVAAPEAPLPDAPPLQAPIEEAPPVVANSWWSCNSAAGPSGLWIWAALALFRRGSVSKNNG